MMYGREAPPEVLDQLREIDPRADLVYWGEGIWKLGRWNERVRWNSIAAERLNRLYAHPYSPRREKEIALEKMRLRGFAVTNEYRFERDENWGLVREDLRERIFNLHNRAVEALEANLDKAGKGDRQGAKALVEHALMEGYDLFKHFVGRPTATVKRSIA